MIPDKRLECFHLGWWQNNVHLSSLHDDFKQKNHQCSNATARQIRYCGLLPAWPGSWSYQKLKMTKKKWFTYHIRCFFCDIFGMSKSSLHPVTSEHYKVGIREISLTSGHYHLRLATRSKLSICINDSKAWRSQVLLLQSCLHSCKNIWGSIWTNDLCYDFEIYIYI